MRDNRARNSFPALTAAAIFFLIALPAHAVVIQGVNSTPAPSSINNIGRRGAGSAIYLGNGWVMTANHVGKGAVTFGSTTYSAHPDPAIQLHSPTNTDDPTDIILYKLASDPMLPALNIAISAPTAGQTVTMAGYSRDRAPDLTYWDKQDSTWVVSTPQQADYSGYTTSSYRSLTWGTNSIENPAASTTVSGLSALTFTTRMDNSPTLDEAQGVEGDSGGAVFTTSGSSTLLAGMMISVIRSSGQPDYTAVYTNTTHILRLNEYRDQIMDIIAYENLIPEPGSVALLGLTSVTLMRRRPS